MQYVVIIFVAILFIVCAPIIFVFQSINGKEKAVIEHFHDNLELYRRSASAAMSGRKDEAPFKDRIFVVYEDAVEFQSDPNDFYYVIVYATSRAAFEDTEAFYDACKTKELQQGFYLVVRDWN